MIDVIIRYTSRTGKSTWAKGKADSKADAIRTFSHMTYVDKVHKAYSIPELLKELTEKEIIL